MTVYEALMFAMSFSGVILTTVAVIVSIIIAMLSNKK